MTQYTAGPWAVKPFIHDGRIVTYDIVGGKDAGAPMIAMVQYVDTPDGCHVVGCETGGANARLIAAAPELLAALQATVAALDLSHATGRDADICAAARELGLEVIQRATEAAPRTPEGWSHV